LFPAKNLESDLGKVYRAPWQGTLQIP